MERKHEICEMRILVTAATNFEIDPFLAANLPAEVLITGVGIPSTLYHLQKRLHQQNVDLVIQAGIAGTFDHQGALGEVTLVKEDCFADIGIEENENFTNLFKAGFADDNEFPYVNGWLINSNPLLVISPLPAVRAITVNQVTDRLMVRNQAIRNYSPQLESMEGAALHYVCLQEKIAFLQIRSISNYVGERNKNNWRMKEAVGNLNVELISLAEKLLIG